MSNLFENVSLTCRVSKGACESHYGPTPPSAVLLPLPGCPEVAARGSSPPPPATPFHQDRGDARKVRCWLPEWTWEPAPELYGKDRLIVCRCADSPGELVECFTQVLLNDTTPLSN